MSDIRFSFRMIKPGEDTDGIVELKMQKPADKVPGNLPDCSLSVRNLSQDNRVIAAQLKVEIAEDPRLKAFSVFSAYSGRGVGVVKHAPNEVYCGFWVYRINQNKGPTWKDETDLIGDPENQWAPHLFEFSPSDEVKLGMIRGNEGDTTSAVFLNKYKTYYSLEDYVQNVRLFGKFEENPSSSISEEGDSIVDKINKERERNSVEALAGEGALVTMAQSHVDYLEISNWVGEKDYFGTSYKQEAFKLGLEIEFSEYSRLVHIEKGVGTNPDGTVDWPSFFDRAMAHWLGGAYRERVTILREDFNAIGFATKTVIETTSPKTLYKVILCVDFAKVDGRVGTSTDKGTTFAVHSYNPICNVFYFNNFYPIPSEIYYLYGIFNDTSALTPEDRENLDFKNWPLEKITAWRFAFWPERNPPKNPTDYPVFMKQVIFSTDYLEAGIITERTQPAPGKFWTYTVVTNDGGIRKNVNGFSHVAYPIGRWVVISRGRSWYITPSSDLYHQNVQMHGEGIG